MKLGFIGENHLAGVEADANFAKEHGFVGLEYNYWGDFANLTAEDVAQMRAILDKHGVRPRRWGCGAGTTSRRTRPNASRLT